jgi:glycosyltransferase involved in cell wall biosynthesis
MKPVLLVGNYPLDGQESMDRFTATLAQHLGQRGVKYEVITPRPRLGRLLGKYTFSGLPKWLGYLDKYLLFPRELARRTRAGWQVHITDHSNAMYARRGRGDVVTCHDLLAVRGALGEPTDCPAGVTGRILQKWILRGVDRAAIICCVSQSTADDVKRLLPQRVKESVRVVPNALNYPYGGQSVDERVQRLADIGLMQGSDYILHVGSNLARKNKEAVFRAVASAGSSFAGKIVFAGPPLSTGLWELAKELGLLDRVYEVVKPGNADLEALYAGARALVFPSRWEGFGWPLIEAQACGCPVICGNQSASPEVAGAGAILCSPDDYEALGDAIREIQDPDTRNRLVELGRQNVARFSTEIMMRGYLEAYGMACLGRNL